MGRRVGELAPLYNYKTFKRIFWVECESTRGVIRTARHGKRRSSFGENRSGWLFRRGDGSDIRNIFNVINFIFQFSDWLSGNSFERSNNGMVIFFFKPGPGKRVGDAHDDLPLIESDNTSIFEPGNEVSLGNRQFQFGEHRLPNLAVTQIG